MHVNFSPSIKALVSLIGVNPGEAQSPFPATKFQMASLRGNIFLCNFFIFFPILQSYLINGLVWFPQLISDDRAANSYKTTAFNATSFEHFSSFDKSGHLFDQFSTIFRKISSPLFFYFIVVFLRCRI